MKARATVRPWRLEAPTRLGQAIIIGPEGEPVARCLREGQWTRPTSEQIANAQLILAAVRALDALEHCQATTVGARATEQIREINAILRRYGFGGHFRPGGGDRG